MKIVGEGGSREYITLTRNSARKLLYLSLSPCHTYFYRIVVNHIVLACIGQGWMSDVILLSQLSLFFESGFLLNLELINLVRLPDQKVPRIFCLCLPSARIIGMHHSALLFCVLQIKLDSSCLYSRHFTN